MNEILKEVQKNGPTTSRDLAEELDITLSSVLENLKRLLKWNLLKYETEFRKKDDCSDSDPVRVFSLTEKAKKKIG